FSITNSTAAGGPNLVDFTLQLADPYVFDTANGASVPFAPVPPTEVLTGLDEVNGTTNPPGWVVADNSQNLNMTFTDFDPAETFQWNIDLDPDPLFDGAVFGDELIGSTVTATYSDGQVLAGSLVAVAGNPNASTFVATSGLGGGNGVHVVGSGASVLNSAAITNTDISRSGLNGVHVELSDAASVGAAGIDITSNTIIDNGQAGPGDGVLVQVSNSAQIGSGLLRIDLNDINTNAGNGVGLQAADAALLNAILTGNTITQNTGAGVAVSATPAPTVNVDILGENPVSGVVGQNVISNNQAGGVLFDMNGATTTAVISDAIIANNGGLGIGTTATDGVLNLQVGGPLVTDKVLLDGNAGAGIGYTLLDSASGTLLIQGNEIINTTALAGSPVYTGQAIDIRLTSSSVLNTATATLSGAQILDNVLGSATNAANGNAGAGLNFFADDSTTLDGLLFDNNTVANNGGDGLTFDRQGSAVINGVQISNNLIDSNGDDGIEINARNAGNDLNDYLIAGNQILNAP
ncbi:MAG: right-handed parallel beta-helix repeat-containing protein, partial [Planctomycetaceae bacterium]